MVGEAGRFGEPVAAASAQDDPPGIGLRDEVARGGEDALDAQPGPERRPDAAAAMF